MTAYYYKSPNTPGHLVSKDLGLSHVTKLSIHFPLHGVAYVKAEFFLTVGQAEAVATTLKKFEIREKKKAKR